MSDIIQKLGKVVEQAKCDAPFYVMPRFKNKYDVFEMLGPFMVDFCHASLISQDEAEELCERLNNEYIAKKVLEAYINEANMLLTNQVG